MLISLLSEIYSNKEDIVRLLDQSNIDSSKVFFSTNIHNVWHNVIKLAKHQNKLSSLFKEIIKEFPNNDNLLNFMFKEIDTPQIEQFKDMSDTGTNYYRSDLKDLEKKVNDLNIKLNRLEIHYENLEKAIAELSNKLTDSKRNIIGISGSQLTIISISISIVIFFLVYLITFGL